MKIIKLVFLLFTFGNIFGNKENDLIIDYFVYKKVSNVVVSTCNNGTGTCEDNINLAYHSSQIYYIMIQMTFR